MKTENKRSLPLRGKTSNTAIGIISFPQKVLEPVGNFLKARLSVLRKRKKDVEGEDPFSDSSRVLDNASPDTDAAEQFGHARSSAIKQEITRKIIQTKKALSRLRIGKYGICEVCGQMIDTERLMIYPETTLCASDAAKKEKS